MSKHVCLLAIAIIFIIFSSTRITNDYVVAAQSSFIDYPGNFDDNLRLMQSLDGVTNSSGQQWYDVIPDCACDEATIDKDKFTKTSATNPLLQYYHPGTDSEYRSKGNFSFTSADNSVTIRPGQQCNYVNRQLITSGSASGSPDRVPPGSIGSIEHVNTDIIPFEVLGWKIYNRYDPANQGNPLCPNNPYTLIKVTTSATTTSGLFQDVLRLPDAQIGIPYNATINANGGIKPYKYTVEATVYDLSTTSKITVPRGMLPPGLSIDSQTGVITGMPELPSGSINRPEDLTFMFTIFAEDDVGLVLNGRTGSQAFEIHVQPTTNESLGGEIVLATAKPGSNLLDLMFVIDTTGSMQDDILEVQHRALDVINQVAASGADWRIGIVTYRDHPQAPYGDPSDYLTQVDRTFSSNQNDIISAINGITVAGGGDGPEAVFAGLLEAIHQPWRNGARKVIILMGDAPPHDPDPLLGYTSQTVLQAAYDVDPASIFPILIESKNAVRFPFQVLADGSSGQLFYASNASEVVPTLLTTINAATGTKLSIGLEVQIASLEPDFPIRTSPSMRASTIGRIPRSEHVTIIDGPKVVFEMSNRNVPENFIWWKVRTQKGSDGWIQETYYGEPMLVPFSGTNPIPEVTCTLSTIRDVNIRSGPDASYQQIASRAGAGQILAADGQYGNASNPKEHWWRLYTGFWIRDDQVREQTSATCAALPVVSS